MGMHTARRCSRSDLFPISMMVMLEFECCLASSSQEVRWLKVSRLPRAQSAVSAHSAQEGAARTRPCDVVDQQGTGSTAVV